LKSKVIIKILLIFCFLYFFNFFTSKSIWAGNTGISGGFDVSGTRVPGEKETGAGSMDLNWQIRDVSLSFKGSGSYVPSPSDPNRLTFKENEKVLKLSGKKFGLTFGDITPDFTEFTLSSPSNERGLSLYADVVGFKFTPVYLLLQKANRQEKKSERELLGMSVEKSFFSDGLNLGVGTYQRQDDKDSIKEWGENTPQEVLTFGAKMTVKPVEILEINFHGAQSEIKDDVRISSEAVKKSAYAAGLNLNWDRWNIRTNYSYCPKGFIAAGTDSTDDDKKKMATSLGYTFSDYINSTFDLTREIDGISQRSLDVINKDNTLINLDFHFPKIPSININHGAMRNKNKRLTINNYNKDYGANISYTIQKLLTGLNISGETRRSSFKDFTFQSDPTRTVYYSATFNIPVPLWIQFNLSSNWSYSRDTNLNSHQINYNENKSVSFSSMLFNGKMMLNLAANKNNNYDSSKTTDVENSGLTGSLSIDICKGLKLNGNASFSKTKNLLTGDTTKTKEMVLATSVVF